MVKFVDLHINITIFQLKVCKNLTHYTHNPNLPNLRLAKFQIPVKTLPVR